MLATVDLLKSSAINRIISFINYLRIITRTNYFISDLNINSAIQWNPFEQSLFGGFMIFYNDTYLEGKAKVTCGNGNPIRPSGFYIPSNGNDYNIMFLFCYANFFSLDLYAGRYAPDAKLKPNATVSGFFAGCTPLEALLPSTLDCLYDVQCLLLLLNYFPTLNKVCSIRLIFIYYSLLPP